MSELKGVLIRGRIRDEYTCPISQQILRDPVVAQDGHTYERSYILRWLKDKKTSPKTNEEISGDVLLPNHNLRRLIHDLLVEGGQGLTYSRQGSSGDEEDNDVLITWEDLLVLKCLGPGESDWMGKTQEVTREGITGGRRRNSSGGKDSMVFTDTTVSRRHFEIGYCELEGRFWIQDLGSAGGTYLRLPHGHAKPLDDGSIFLLGKHQFIALAPSRIGELRAPADAVGVAAPPTMDESTGGGPQVQASLMRTYCEREKGDLVGPDNRPQLVLKCIAPEGSPMQHRMFTLDATGATIGRKQTNLVSLSQEKGDEVLGLDSAVSGEHCRIEYRSEEGFVLLDGVRDKASTNGTWVRLSYMQQASLREFLKKDDEVLIGGILRFLVNFEKTLMEREVPHDERHEQSDDSTATSPDHVKIGFAGPVGSVLGGIKVEEEEDEALMDIAP